jgi:hypothetical protein
VTPENAYALFLPETDFLSNSTLYSLLTLSLPEHPLSDVMRAMQDLHTLGFRSPQEGNYLHIHEC